MYLLSREPSQIACNNFVVLELQGLQELSICPITYKEGAVAAASSGMVLIPLAQSLEEVLPIGSLEGSAAVPGPEVTRSI